jgi:hypothetical protein
MKYIVSLLLLIHVYITFSQQVSSYGAEFDLKEKYKASGELNILGEYDGYKYTTNLKRVFFSGIKLKFKYEISKWHKDGTEPIETIEAKLKGGNFKCSPFNPGFMVLHGASIYHFFISKDRGKSTESLYMNEYSTSKMTIRQTKRITGIKRKKRRYPIYIDFFRDEVNPDKLGMAIEYNVSKTKKKLDLYVFDEKIQTVFTTSRNQSLKSYLSTYSLSDNWIQYNRKVEGKKGTKDKLYLHLIDIKSGEDYQHVCNIQNPNASPISYGVKRAKDGRFLVYGFYSSSLKLKDQAGGFFVQNFSFDGEKKLRNEYIYPIDASFFSEGLSEKKQEKMEKRSSKGKRIDDDFEFEIHNMFEMDDSSFVAVGGSYKFYIQYVTDSKGNTTEIPHHVNKDIFLIRISREGEVLSIKRHERLDDSRNYKIGEVLYYSNGKNIYFIHADEGDIYFGVYNPTDEKLERQTIYFRSDFGRYFPLIGDGQKMIDNNYQIPLIRLKKKRILEIAFPK